MLIKLAWRNLWRNKRRTFITMGSILFAVVLAIYMQSMQEGMYGRMIDNMVGFQLGYVQVHEKGYWDDQLIDNTMAYNEADHKALESHPGVKAAIPRLESFALAAVDEQSRPCLVMGIDPEGEDQVTKLKSKLTKGDYLKTGDTGVMVAEGLADKLHLDMGDTLILLGQGYHGAMAAGKYAISGIVKYGSPDLNTRLVFLTVQAAQEMYASPGRLSSIVLALENNEHAAKIADELGLKLSEKYEVMDWQEMIPELMKMIEADRGSNKLIIGILYVIISFGILGTVLMMTAERNYEFGVMIAIGMRKWRLAVTIFFETVLISLLGVILGAAIALPIVVYFHYNPLYIEALGEVYAEFGFEPILPTVVDAKIFLNQAFTVLIVAILVSLYPAFRIQRIEPVKAMRK